MVLSRKFLRSAINSYEKSKSEKLDTMKLPQNKNKPGQGNKLGF